MKKFIAVSAVFLVAIVAIITTLGCIKPKTDLSYEAPKKVIVYAKSSVAIQNGEKEREFSSSSITYRNIVEKTEEMFDISMLTHAIHGNSVKPVVKQDIENTYGKYSSNLLTSKYAVLLSFDETQTQIVEYQGDQKTIYFKKIIILMDPEKDYQEVPIYFSETADVGTDYKDSPMVVNVKASKLIQYIDEIK